VLAHQREGYRGGDAAEGAGVGADVDEVPGAGVGEACLVLGLDIWRRGLRGLCWSGRDCYCWEYGDAEVRWETYFPYDLRHGVLCEANGLGPGAI
jgi:hypothetical protein